MSRLTLPGSLPGLLRRGSPVLSKKWGSAVVVGIPGDERWDFLEYWQLLADSECFHHACSDDDDLALDLEDATGRAHAAWWLADQMASDPMGLVTHSPFFELAFWANEGEDEVGTFLGWMLNAPAGRWHFLGWDCLHDLDPNDPRTLPDGSRRVDAEALRLVCLHVAGGEV